jgi:hypothetical protein
MIAAATSPSLCDLGAGLRSGGAPRPAPQADRRHAQDGGDHRDDDRGVEPVEERGRRAAGAGVGADDGGDHGQHQGAAGLDEVLTRSPARPCSSGATPLVAATLRGP